jgi:hypothetical protein
VEKYRTAGQITDDMEQRHRLSDKEGKKNALRICILIAFPQQQWSHERASKLRYTHMPLFFFFIYLHFHYKANVTHL